MNLSFIVRRSSIFLVLTLIFALFLGIFAPFVQTSSNVDSFRLKDHPDYRFYQKFQDIFGHDEFFVVAFRKDDIFTYKNLTLLKNLTAELEKLDLTRDVLSLANVDHITGEEDFFYVQPFLGQIPKEEKKLQWLQEQAIENPLYVQQLISKDAKAAAIVVFAYDRPEDPDYRQKLLGQTKEILTKHDTKTSFYLAGWTVTNYSLSRYMQNDLATFIPVTYLLIALVTYAFFQNLRLTLLAVLTISAALGSTMGLFTIFNIPLNNVTTAVPPLVMALTLTAIVHIFTHMQGSVLDKYGDKTQALLHVLRQLFVPCALTTLTTTTGFLSLSVSELEPIRQFSVLAAAGMVFGFLYAFFLLPPVILLCDPHKLYMQVREDQWLSKVLHGLTTLVRAHKGKIICVNAVCIAAALFFAAQIKVETNLLEYFKESSPERQAVDFVQKHLSGVGQLDISVQAGKRDAFKEPHNLAVLQNMEKFLAKQPGVDKVISFNHFIKDMHMSFYNEDPAYYALPDSRQLVSQYLLLYDSDDISDYVNSEYDHTRIAVRLNEHSSREQKLLIQKIQEHIDDLSQTGLSMRVTGQAMQDVNIIQALVSGQVYSLALALLVISVFMFVVFKSLLLGLLCLIPNTFPVLFNFGLMGLLDIPLNTATAIIAAVAIGIVVDDTIHFLSYYTTQRRQGRIVSLAVQSTMLVKGRALVSSSLILCIGFGILLLSNFMPIVYFGMLSAVIMILALVGDLVLLPAILLCKRDQGER